MITRFLTMILVLLSSNPIKAEGENPMEKFTAKALQADVIAGLEHLHGPKSEYSKEDLKLRELLLNRFSAVFKSDTEENLDPFTKKLLALFQQYWWNSLLKKQIQKTLDDQIEEDIIKLMVQFGADPRKLKNDDELEISIKSMLKERGFYSSIGRTIPLLEIILWKKQEEVEYTVELPEGTEKVKVFLLSDFVSKGWLSYATFDYSGTGGWAVKDGLYCITEAYDLHSEKYANSFLRHEAQHFSDLKRFPKLEQAVSEFRAKLTELTFAEEDQEKLLKKFINQSENNPKVPHAVANFQVIQELSRHLGLKSEPWSLDNWQRFSRKQVQKAAKELLIENSKNLSGFH